MKEGKDAFIETVKESTLRAWPVVKEAGDVFCLAEQREHGVRDHDILEMALTMALIREAARIKLVHHKGKVSRKGFEALCGDIFGDVVAMRRARAQGGAAKS